MPRETLRLLDQLEAAGFTNADFQFLHHAGRRSSLPIMRNYCRKTGFFYASSPNTVLKRRLEFILQAYQRGGFSHPAKPGVFRGLCKDALREIPR